MRPRRLWLGLDHCKLRTSLCLMRLQGRRHSLYNDCPGMGRHRQTDVLQGNTMEQYTTVGPLLQHAARLGGTEEGQSGLPPPEELSRAKILAAIQGSRVAPEGKIETVAVEVNLLRADLRKVSDKVKVAEGSIVELQVEIGALQEVWRWLEMWDKATPSRLTRSGGVAPRASRADGPDWRIREGDLLEDTVAWGLDVDPALRIKIQQDGTMAVIHAESVDGSGGRPDLDSLLASTKD
ncbi:hypothetical protein NDU88_005760 [Pleurodeles waltl]|uniref:Uncharacterized protein n=1 Tax=Pleurodeles waltl TaxID=8319 RepID=A0AAV7WBK7_PLEWA|nr:hypothetical protein NDU88_005760 [Pleurodeles waltl]